MGVMAVPTIALPEARNALNRAADRWADLLRSLPDTRATIPGSRWTVGDAAAHVVMDVRTEALVAAGEAVSWAEGATSAPGTPRGAAELNARAVTAEAERDPRALADMLVTAVGDFLAASGRASGTAPCLVWTHPPVGTDRQGPTGHVGPSAMAGPGLQATVPQPLSDIYRPAHLARHRAARPPACKSMAKMSSNVHGLAWRVPSVHLSPAASRLVGVGCGCHRGSLRSTCTCWLVLQAFGQPGVHFADAVFCECQVPIIIEQPGFDPGDMGGQPLAVPEGNEVVLPAVQEQHGDGDARPARTPTGRGGRDCHPSIPGCPARVRHEWHLPSMPRTVRMPERAGTDVP